MFDVVVIGSGCCGVQVAQTLVESGACVCLLDIGNESDFEVPKKEYFQLKKEDPLQWKYFIGNRFEGLNLNEAQVGDNLMPSRSYIKDIKHFFPSESKTFNPLESPALGGLGSGWGLGVSTFNQTELKKVGLDCEDIQKAYFEISERIGLSGSKKDDTSDELYQGLKLQPPIKLEKNSEKIISLYRKKQNQLNQGNIKLGRPALALLTKPLKKRPAYQNKDMFFYRNDGSEYRPHITIEELKKYPNFTYQNQSMALTFQEYNEGVSVTYIDPSEPKNYKVIKAKRVVLATGALGTARIVSRSRTHNAVSMPILANPFFYIPCIQWSSLGRVLEKHKFPGAQLILNYDPKNQDLSFGSIYGYRTMPIHKLVSQMPLGVKWSKAFVKFIHSALMICAIQHPDTQVKKNKYIQLVPDQNSITKDKCLMNYQLDAKQIKEINKRNKIFKKTMKQLGCFPLKTMNMGHATSIHYAGTVPRKNNGKDIFTKPDYRLNETEHVYIADGSTFNFLPAKGLTFTLMAQAHVVAKHVIKSLNNKI